jgi:hypothetical protein
MNQEQKQENAKKYGAPGQDVIAQAYAESKAAGDAFCKYTAIKYLDRFTRQGSKKAGNVLDLYKAADFLGRMIQANGQEIKPEVIEK